MSAIASIILGLIVTAAEQHLGSESAAFAPTSWGVGFTTLLRLLLLPALTVLNHNQVADIDIFSIVLGVILSLAGLFYAFKLFFEILKRYATLYMIVIFAPVLLLFAMIPGKQDIIKKWLRAVVANTLIFPAVTLVIITGVFVTQAGDRFLSLGDPTGNPVSGLLTGAAGSATFAGFLALGMLSIATKLPKTILSFFQVSTPALLADAWGVGMAGYKGGLAGINKYAVSPATDVVRSKSLVKPILDRSPKPVQKILLAG